jgi:hypothetical protein
MATPEEIWARAQLDPSYLAAHGGNAKALQDLILNYGSSSALSPELAGQYGIQPGQVSAADQNPYSVQAQLGKLLSGDQYGITNNANAHGALYSGAHQAQQLHEIGNAGQRNYNAQQTLAQQIAGITGNDTNALTGAFGRLSDQALNTPVPQPAPVAIPDAVAPAAPAAPAAPPLNGLGQPWIDPGARENMVQPPPAPTPKVIAAKQIVGQAARGFQGSA